MASAYGPVVPTSPSRCTLRPLDAGAVRLDPGGLLGSWQARNAAATLPHCIEQLDVRGNLRNLRRVTGEADGAFSGMWFADSDVYKTLEAAFWDLGRSGGGDPAFRAEVTALLEKAQDPDGYLDSYYQTDHRDRQWSELHYSHEMYCAGHLIQAAVAAARAAAGDEAGQQLVGVARRFADLLVRRYGPDGADGICGHPEIETALVELYRVTGHRPYLALAARFVELRGHGLLGGDRFGPRYFQDHAPVRHAREVAGHVVRQVYLLAGAVDVAVENGDAELLAATERLWESALASRTYLTGGQGSRHRDEAFGDPYELPPDRAYAETCAAIGSFQWAWRLLLATGRVRYADAMERFLYNGIAVGIGQSGREFFYANPLQLRTGHDGSDEDAPTQRLPWYSCACCPPNLARLMASLHHYTATGDARGLQLHLYASGRYASAGRTIEVSGDYPWDGRISITVRATDERPWTLALRVPDWCASARLSVNGAEFGAPAQAGYLRLARTWQPGDRVELVLAMPPRLIAAHPRVDAVRGTVALARGPLVYCLEHLDVPEALSGAVFEDIELDPAGPVQAVPAAGLAPVRLTATVSARGSTDDDLYRPLDPAARPAATGAVVSSVPYFLWANRAAGPMRVWIPLAGPAAP
ncbi:glycoside hydrolase family 127 protein [Plantactinospora sp. KBS50]|uniref:glycoside hydrolase family 127 protein n=1 Tax=Plantactinospora sp. KBS50 TaxID=2024580 RepID=UPI000BAAC208|nr:beta-L-arabinofuranosidase domain-containing protein [Plantactinospora sp. KBS50]ASW54448.1 hypothetical protein CIK06_09995 [Plantactinospora sp. KBS50]